MERARSLLREVGARLRESECVKVRVRVRMRVRVRVTMPTTSLILDASDLLFLQGARRDDGDLREFGSCYPMISKYNDF